MACPWFFPLERLGPARSVMPLGDIWAGRCGAPGAPEGAAGSQFLVACCNLGYARNKCPRFPAGDGPDAVRFAVSARHGDALRIWCVVEKAYLPFGGAHLEYDLGSQTFTNPPGDRALERQARAYAASYLLRSERS